MGFLSHFFKKKSGNTNAGKGPATYSPEWELFYKNIDHKLGVVSVDLGIGNVAPLHYQYNLLWVRLVMTNPLENGLTSQSEAGQIEEIEKRLYHKIEEDYDATYVGRKVSAGQQTFYFYIGDTLGYEAAIKHEMKGFPQYQFDFGTEEDTDWNMYFKVLFPDEFQWLSIMNRKTIEALKEQGDTLEKERTVRHHLCFETEDGRKQFLKDAEDGGYAFEDQGENKKNSEFPFLLEISRINLVDQDHVDQYVLLLSEHAKELGGKYVRFECAVVS